MSTPYRTMRFGYTVIAVIGLLTGVCFGRIWLNILPEDLAWKHDLKTAGWVVMTIFVVAGAVALLRISRTPLYWRGQLPRSAWYIWLVVLIVLEISLIAIGNTFFQENNQAGWEPTWTLFIVGAHFAGFAYIFRISAFYRLASAMCAASVLSVLISGFVGATRLWFILPGLGGAFSLWCFTGWALYRILTGKWIDIKEQQNNN